MLVSAFAFGGLPQRVLRRVVQRADVYLSSELLEEYRAVPEKLLAEGKITREQWRVLIAGIASFVAGAKVIYPKRRVDACRDPEDNMILECCLAARADMLVTGDKDLLTMDPQTLQGAGLGELQILNPRAYLGSAGV